VESWNTVATAKAERMLNLVIALLNTRQFRTATWIRDKVAGYGEAPSTEAFNRMFERDKQELREMGIPLLTDDRDGYRIPQVEFSLPELNFTPAETAALGLAARLWSTTALESAGAGAVRKITDAGEPAKGRKRGPAQRTRGPVQRTEPPLLQPRVRTGDPAFRPLWQAVQARRAVRFGYRKDGDRDAQTRHLQPWGLVSYRGRWYVVGFDLDRGERRTFRLSRITGSVNATGPAGAVRIPSGVNLLEMVRASVSPAARRSARVRVRVDAGAGLRRAATAVHRTAEPDWELVDLPMSGLWDTARQIAALGPDARVEEPHDLRDAVIHVLDGARELDRQPFPPGLAEVLRPATRARARGGRNRPNRASAAAQAQENATERVARVLSMVPYIARRPGISVAALATEFAVSDDQVTKDLELLMVCGLPGYYPDDLIDVVLSDDGTEVSIGFDAGLERPVRLTTDEAVALTVALRALGDRSGLGAGDAVRTALAKLEAVTAGFEPTIDVVPGDEAPALGVVTDALDRGRQLWMRYYTASRDAVSERTVDPIRLILTDGHTYLEAYCHLVSAVRQFRVDRIEDARVTEAPAQPPLWVDDEVPDRMYHPDPHRPVDTLVLHPEARWIAEYYSVDEIVELPDDDAGPSGFLMVRMRTPGGDWLVRLLLSLGGDAQIVDREELTARVVERATAALELYRERQPA
jgi:proteasome accessory factor C